MSGEPLDPRTGIGHHERVANLDFRQGHRLAGSPFPDAERGQHDTVLHDRDQSHPTPAGSYLAACVFLAVLFGENPVGISGAVPGLDESDVSALQRTAWQACQPAPSNRGKA